MASLCPKCLSEVEPGRALCERCAIDPGRGEGEDGRAGDREASSLLEGTFKPPPFVIPGFPSADESAPCDRGRSHGGAPGRVASHEGTGSSPGRDSNTRSDDAASDRVEERGTRLGSLLGPASRPVPGGQSPPAHVSRSETTGVPKAPSGSDAGPEPPPTGSGSTAPSISGPPETSPPADPKGRARRLRVPIVGGAAVVAIVVALVSVLAATGGTSKPSLPAADDHAGATRGARPAVRLERKTLPGATTTKKPGKTVQVSVPLTTTSDDPRPEVEVRIGNDAPLRVVLDTGSVGLRVFADALPTGAGRGIEVTTARDEVEYADGTQFAGAVSYAKVYIGRLTTTTTIPFQLVQQVTCDPDVAVCPASGGAQQFQSEGIDGYMGIGLGGPYQGDPAANPLLALPLPYGRSWSIAMSGGGTNLPASGTLVLGAVDPNKAVAEFSLQQAGGKSLGSPTWNDQFDLCWDVGGQSSCELTVFDSGSDLTILGGNDFSSAPTDDPGEVGILNTGTQVQCSQQVDGNPMWSFDAEGGPMQTVYVEPSGPDWVNSGVQAFYSFTVTYDEAEGHIILS